MRYSAPAKPFKFDKSDPGREYDLLRAIVIFRLYGNYGHRLCKVKQTLKFARLDLPQYLKLKKDYPHINISTVEALSERYKYNIKIWCKNSTQSTPQLMYKTSSNFGKL